MPEDLLGRIVWINIDEPSSYAERHDNEREGRIRRVLRGGWLSGLGFYFVVVELDRAWIHRDQALTVISIMARHSDRDILDLAAGDSIGVNINKEPDWILDCPEDDPRLKEGRDSLYIGYGVAKLMNVRL